MGYRPLLTFISKFCSGDSAFVIFVPRKCFKEGLIKRGCVTSQKFKFANMELVPYWFCISRKALYKVIEAKQCLYPPPPPPHNNFTVQMLILGHLGFFFVLSGNASLSYNFTNLVFVTSLLLFSVQ